MVRPNFLTLPLLNGGVHFCHFDLEHQFHSGLDLRLGGIAQHFEQNLVQLLADARGLLGNDRGDEHLAQPAFVELLFDGIDAAHANISFNCSIAPLVTSTFL